MSSLSPLSPLSTPVATALPDSSGRSAPLPAQQASAPTVPVAVGAVQALSSSAGKNALDKEELAQATEKISKLVATFASELNFSIDEDLGVPIVKVIDKHTDKVIRQIPTEEVLEMSKNLDKLVGVLYQSKA